MRVQAGIELQGPCSSKLCPAQSRAGSSVEFLVPSMLIVLTQQRNDPHDQIDLTHTLDIGVT